MIKYLGSKRVLVPVLGTLFAASGARTALDLFTGTTRVAQEFCRRGGVVTTVDVATYSEVLSQCYVVLDAAQVDRAEVQDAIDRLHALPGKRGYVTETFCEQSRYFQPQNGMRIDAIRDGIERCYGDSWLRPVLLTSLLEAADAVDSTVGLQMAYLKQWAPRSYKDLAMQVPRMTPGTGTAIRGDATEVVSRLPHVDLAYLDPPYNQHRYFTNYHVWESLVRWDAPLSYGIARKRIDSRDPATKSVFNRKRAMPSALAETIRRVDAEVVVVSFSDEGYVPLAELVDMCTARGDEVEVLAFDSRRHVGARIGIYNRAGAKVGNVGHTRNTEYLVVSGPGEKIEQMNRALQPAVGATGDVTVPR